MVFFPPPLLNQSHLFNNFSFSPSLFNWIGKLFLIVSLSFFTFSLLYWISINPIFCMFSSLSSTLFKLLQFFCCCFPSLVFLYFQFFRCSNLPSFLSLSPSFFVYLSFPLSSTLFKLFPFIHFLFSLICVFFSISIFLCSNLPSSVLTFIWIKPTYFTYLSVFFRPHFAVPFPSSKSVRFIKHLFMIYRFTCPFSP